MTDAPDITASPTDTEQPKTGSATGSATTEPKFTQADLDRVAGDTRKKARETALAEALKELGVDKLDDAKALVTSAREKADADKTEAQKATDRADAAEKKRLEAEQKLTDLLAKQTLDARNSAIKAAAQAGGMTRPDMAMSWLRDNAASDLDALKAGDDGKYDEKAVKALVEKVRKELPELFKPTSPGSPSLRDGRAPEPGQRAAEARSRRTHGNIIRG